MAHTYRRATLKVSFTAEHARPRAHEVETFIREELRLDPRDVIGIHFSITSSVVYIKMTNIEVCQDVIRRHANGLKFKYSDGHVGAVSVELAEYGLRTIRVFELPFEVPQDAVVSALRPYGNVIGYQEEKWQTFTTYHVLNGVRQVKIELSKHIPSYLTIGGVRAIIMYDGQPRTCAGCGQEGHVRSECMQRRLIQTPVGEEAPPAVITQIPVTYAKVAQDNTTASQCLSDPLTSSSQVDAAAAEIPSEAPQTPDLELSHLRSKVTDIPAEMDVDPGVVPTSAFLQTGPESDDSRPHSDSEQHVRKQRSPRKRKKRSRTSSNDSPLQMGTRDADQKVADGQLFDKRVSDVDGPPQETTVNAPLSIPSLPPAQMDVEVDSSEAPTATSSPNVDDVSNRYPPAASVSWADDVEIGMPSVDGAADGAPPSVAPAPALSP